MTIENADTQSAQVETGVTEAAAVEVSQEQNVESAQSSAETKNTESANEYMIPKSRFDEVNNKYKALKDREQDLEIVDQLNNLFEQDSELAQEFETMIQKRVKARESSQQTQTQAKDPTVENLSREVARLKAGQTVEKYTSDFQKLAKGENLTPEQAEVYREDVENLVVQMKKGDLTQYDPKIVSEAFETIKAKYSRLVQPQKPAANVPVNKAPNAPIETQKLNSREDRIRFIANGLKSGRTGGL